LPHCDFEAITHMLVHIETQADGARMLSYRATREPDCTGANRAAA
jgi:alkylation response protein AidB-like acyl-CoA dehydrogenase